MDFEAEYGNFVKLLELNQEIEMEMKLANHN
jgi:hypothetical protein